MSGARQAIAAWIAVGGIASGIGPTVGALFVQFGDWRGAFFLNVRHRRPGAAGGRAACSARTEAHADARIARSRGHRVAHGRRWACWHS